MVFDWLSGQFGEATVTDLIARKRYARAIEVLKEQISKRPPSVQTRLQLADVLVLAGRGREAIPYFLQIADELANDGFSARAVAIFKKVEKLEPGRPDVSLKLQALATLGRTVVAPETQQRSQSPGGDGSEFMRLVDFGIEEVGAVTWRRIQQQREEKEKAEQSPEEATEGPEPSALVDPAYESNEAGSSSAVAAVPEVAVDSVETETPVETTAESSSEPADTPAPVIEPPTPPASEPEEPEPAAVTIDPADVIFDPPAGAKEEAAPVLAPESTPTTAEPIVDGDQVVPVPPVAAEAGVVGGSEEPEPAAVMIDSADVIFDPPAGAKADAPAPALEPKSASTTAAPIVDGDPVVPVAPDAAEPDVASSPSEVLTPPLSESEEPDPAADPTAPATFVLDEELGAPEMAQSVFDDQVLDVIEALVATPPKTEAPSEESPASQPVPVPRHNVLMASLTDEDAFSLLQRMRLVSLMPGDVVLTEGERSDGLFILAAGRAKVFVQGEGQRNLPIGFLREGDFFGEAPSITGRPRSATVVCAEPCELLVIDGDSLSDELERHPNLRGILEEFFVERSRRDAAPEPVPVSAETPPASPVGLEDLAGIRKWDPRSRLRLADVLLKAGRHEEAGPILVALADDFMQQGFPEKAVAILKKTEALHRRRIGQLAGAAPEENAAPPSPHSATKGKVASTGSFDRWLVTLARAVVVRNKPDAGSSIAAAPTGRSLAGYIPGLTASPLLSGLPAPDLEALMAELRLASFEPGDIVVTEGEAGDSVFILARGAVKVWVHDTIGRCVEVCLLEEGSFFGEIAGVLRQKRSATVTAADACELLVLSRTTLNHLIEAHPDVAAVVGDYAARRSLDPRVSAARTAADREPA